MTARVFVAALVLAVLVVIGIVGLVWALVDQRTSQDVSARTDEVLLASRDLEASAIDLETGIRGFAITANPAFLEPWRAAERAIPAQIEALRALARGGGSGAGVDRLIGLVQEYRWWWSTPLVELTRADPAAARERIGRGGGKRRMDQIRAGFAELLVSERGLVAARRAQSESAADLALALGLACAIGSALLILGFAAYLRVTVLRPIRRVAATAERFAGGDRGARATTGGATELDLLARSFNDMAHTVQVESAERARVQAELRERGDEFRALAENSPDIIVRVDAEMRISYVNSVVVGVTGLTAESFLGRSILEIEGELPVPLDWSRALREVLDTGEPRRIEHPFESPAGTVWFESRMIPETSPDGIVGHALVLLLALASTDPLTGLPNLRTFTQRLGDEVVKARRHSRPLSLMMIDIDHFKLINDTHGHEVGNQVLIEIARRLAELARGEDTVARVGGEEFAWILPESDARGAYWVAERARAAVAETPFRGVGHLTISAGVCEIDEAAYPDELFRRADAALYSAKAQGRNTSVRCSPDDAVIPTRSSPEASTSGPAPPD